MFIPGILYTPRITMKLYDMIQVYSSGSTVIMNMHCIWPVLHMTSCLVAIKKKQRYVFWYEKWPKNIFQWGNPGERLSECVEGVEIYKINLKKKKLTYLKSFMQRIIQKRILELNTMHPSVFTELLINLLKFLPFNWEFKLSSYRDIKNGVKYKYIMCISSHLVAKYR